VGVAAGVFFFATGFRSLRQRRVVEDTPTSQAGAVAVGPVEIVGRARPLPGDPVIAPFTGERCAFVAWKVERKRGRHWETVMEGHGNAFLVRDPSGRILVDGLGADVSRLPSTSIDSGLASDPPARIQEFCKARGIEWRTLGVNRAMRWTETAVLPGSHVYVLGTAQIDPRGTEWTKRGVATNPLVVQKGRPGSPFVIGETEQKVRRSFRNASLWGIYGGSALAVGSAAALLHDLGMFG